jgi:tRNA nucleotidyltransferase (CCA-adding enzyme)
METNCSSSQGHEISRALGASKPGPWLGKALLEVVKWQLKHPEGTKEECASWLEDERRKGNIDVDEDRPFKRVQRNAKKVSTRRSKK